MGDIILKTIADCLWAASIASFATIGVMFTCWAFSWMPVSVSIAVVPNKEDSHDKAQS